MMRAFQLRKLAPLALSDQNRPHTSSMNVLGLSVSASGGRQSMRWSTRAFFSLFTGLLLVCGNLTLRAAQQTGSSPSTDQSDATTSAKKKTKTKAASADASKGTK